MSKPIIQIIKQKNKKEIIQKQETTKILSLDDPADDDLHKIYFVESDESIKGKYYRIIATAFGATSCSCIEQKRNPYQTCKHMKILDEILEQYPNKIQNVKYIP